MARPSLAVASGTPWKTALCQALAVACATVAIAAHAAEAPYPTRPIRLVVSYPPGGGVDALARALAPKLGAAMGQSWVVENVSGAGGNLGAERVATAAPDGHTVLIAADSQLTVSPTLYKLPFNVERDLQPVTLVATAEYIVVVNPRVPAKTLQEFVTLAKQKPGVLNYASGGVGTPVHLASELLMKRTGIDVVAITYKGGGPAAAAVLAGETEILVGTVASTIGYVTAGRLRALATTGAKRSRVAPDLPTVAESGYPGFEASLWIGLFIPGSTPKAVAERIRAETAKALQFPDVQAAMARQGQDPVTSTPAELAARIKAETSMWADVIKAAGIRAE